MVGIFTIVVAALVANCALAAPVRNHHHPGAPGEASSAVIPAGVAATAVTDAPTPTVPAAANAVDASILSAALAASAAVASTISAEDAANTVFSSNPNDPAIQGNFAFLRTKIDLEMAAGENDAAAADEQTLLDLENAALGSQGR